MTAPHFVAGKADGSPEERQGFRDKFERYLAPDRHIPDLRCKAYTAIAAKMARTIHAVVKSGEPYRPFCE